MFVVMLNAPGTLIAEVAFSLSNSCRTTQLLHIYDLIYLFGLFTVERLVAASLQHITRIHELKAMKSARPAAGSRLLFPFARLHDPETWIAYWCLPCRWDGISSMLALSILWL